MLISQKKCKQNKKIFSKKQYMPYEIGYISKSKNKINLSKFFKMVKKNTCVFISGKGSNLKNLFYISRL